ncbi:MAG: DUF308 domain-containing protein [Caldilineaceae bacterium]|nr:DUF308 domain-containing protein [Caldilineaceae bacterium]
MTTADIAAMSDALRREISKNWWILLVQGICAILLGILLFTNPATTLISLAFVLGIFWIVGGIADIIGAFTGRGGNRHWFWQLLSGIIGVIVGFLFVSQPVVGAVALPFTMTLLLGIGAITSGIFNIIGAIMMRKEISGEIWMIIWGVVSILLGFWILSNLGAASVAYVYVAAIFAIIGGIISIFGAFRLRSLGRR